MYTYYLLTIWMPEIKSSIEVKKNITRLQMVNLPSIAKLLPTQFPSNFMVFFHLFHFIQVQFGYLVIHFGHGFVIPGNECVYPKFLSMMGVTQNLFMIVLFSDFYRRAYGKKADKKIHEK